MNTQYQTAAPNAGSDAAQRASIEPVPELSRIPRSNPVAGQRWSTVNDALAVELVVCSTTLVGLVAAISTLMN